MIEAIVASVPSAAFVALPALRWMENSL